MPVGSVAPFVEIPPVTAVERRHQVAQEVGLPPASAPAERRLRHHRVSFEESRSGEDPREGSGCHFSEKPVERFEAASRAELHLCRMPPLVDRQVPHPRHRCRSIRIIDSEYVHPFRRPCDRCVRQDVAAVQHHGHLSPVTLPDEKP